MENKKILKLSHSGMNKYVECAKSYQLHYQKRIRSYKLPSALLFGKAMDSSLNKMLETFDKTTPEDCLNQSIEEFDKQWDAQKDNFDNMVKLSKNVDIEWNKSDYDGDLLAKKDWSTIFSMSEEPFAEKDTNPELNSYMNWISLKRKAHLLIQAYQEQIVPKIDKVVVVQQAFNISDGTNGILNGFIDVVLTLKTGEVVVLDNKTTSMQYAEDSVKESIQLSIYLKVLEIMKEEGTYTDLLPTHAGYAVLSKKINKKITKTCLECSTIQPEGSKMKKCDATTEEGERCNGNFNKDKEFSVDTQLIVDKIPETMVQLVLENVDEIKKCIENDIFPRNFNSCVNKYGKKCVYFDYCRTNDGTGLIELPERELMSKNKWFSDEELETNSTLEILDDVDVILEEAESSITLTHVAYVPVLNEQRNRYDIVTIRFNPNFMEKAKPEITKEETNFDERGMADRYVAKKYIEDEHQRLNRELLKK